MAVGYPFGDKKPPPKVFGILPFINLPLINVMIFSPLDYPGNFHNFPDTTREDLLWILP